MEEMIDQMTAEEYNALVAKQKQSKYRNVPTEVDGIRFDSKAEAEHYAKLRLMQLSGEIYDLQLQPSFRLEVNGLLICRYVADFSYRDQYGLNVEDVKSPATITPIYRVKKKLMQALYGIEIYEVMR